MKNITIEKLNITLNLDLDGQLLNLTNDKNYMLFSINNSDFFLNAYLDKKTTELSIEEYINKEVYTLKQMDFKKSKITFLKEKLSNFSNIKIYKLDKINEMLYNTNAILLQKDNTKQLQFYVEINNYVLIIGLMLFNEINLTQQNFMSYNTVKKIVEAIASINYIN